MCVYVIVGVLIMSYFFISSFVVKLFDSGNKKNKQNPEIFATLFMSKIVFEFFLHHDDSVVQLHQQVERE